MEAKELLSLALYAVAIGFGALAIAISVVGGYSLVITFLGIAVFCLGVAGISLLGRKKK